MENVDRPMRRESKAAILVKEKKVKCTKDQAIFLMSKLSGFSKTENGKFFHSLACVTYNQK